MSRSLDEALVTLEDWDGDALRTGRLAELGLMAAELVHELRQPLFAVRALAQLAMEGPGDDAHRRLRELLTQVDLLQGILDGVSAFARNDEPRTLAPVDVEAPCRAAVDLLRHRARRLGVALTLEAAAEVPPAAADPTGLVQVVVNLVQNALDACPSGSEVVVRTRVEGGAVVVEVADDGPGVPEALRERVFEPFFTTKGPGRGTGLGLPLARQLVQRNLGTLELVHLERGTVARVRLRPWS